MPFSIKYLYTYTVAKLVSNLEIVSLSEYIFFLYLSNEKLHVGCTNL